MKENFNILSELNELNSSLAGKAATNPYTVPAGYFDNLVEKVLLRIQSEGAISTEEELRTLSPFLHTISRQMPYSVPDDYFAQLPERILALTKQTAAEELESLSPFLSGLKKENPYSVPQGYFENIPAPVEENQPATKVVSLRRSKWMRLAVAAAFIGMAAVAGVKLFTSNKAAKGDAIAGVKKDIKNLNEDQKDNLIDFLDVSMNTDETSTASTDVKNTEVKNLLQDVSAEELSDFEQQTEDMGDILMVN